MTEWSIAVGVGGGTCSSPSEEHVSLLAASLAQHSPVISVGQDMLMLRFTREADDPVDAAASAVPDVLTALDLSGCLKCRVRKLEVTEWPLFEQEIEEPTFPDLVGVSEIAELLGTSRQRASELARSERFPAPIAELKAGPIWFKPAIRRFCSEWERKPGRPRSSATEQRLQELIAERQEREREAANEL